MKFSVLLLVMVFLAIGLVSSGSSGGIVLFYVKPSTVIEYNASFYVVVHGVRGRALNANVSAIIVSLHGNYSDIQEFKYVYVVGANNTSRTLKYSDRVRLFYPNPYSIVVGPGVIPYLLSKSITDSLWSGKIGNVNISFWNLTNTSLRLSNLKVNTSIGLCKCILIKGVYRREYLLYNTTATLCYNRYGLLGYANISTGYLEPANMRNTLRILEYRVVNASIKVNKELLNNGKIGYGISNNAGGETGNSFNCTLVCLPIILFIIGIGAWFRYKYLRK